MQVAIAIILGMDRHRRVAEHRLGPGRRDDDVLAGRTVDRIAEMPEGAGPRLVLDFQVRDRGEGARIPVHHVLAAVDETPLVQADEALGHGTGQAGIHGEPLPGPVAAGTHSLELVHDPAAVLLLPGPDVLQELLTPDPSAVHSLLGKVPLDEHLRGDSGVVGAGQPENVPALHALPAHGDVDLRGLEHVPHVQRSGHVRRRNHQGEDGVRGGFVGPEEAFLHPPFRPSRLDARWLVGFC